MTLTRFHGCAWGIVDFEGGTHFSDGIEDFGHICNVVTEEN